MDFVARYYGDPEYRARADQDPTAAAKAAGMDIPEGVQVRLWFNSDDRNPYRDTGTTALRRPRGQRDR